VVLDAIDDQTLQNLLRKIGAGDGIEPVLPAWESRFSILYFQYLQNRSAKMCVHALHTVHAVPDLRVTAGRLRDDFYHVDVRDRRFEVPLCCSAQADIRVQNDTLSRCA
jgi:hypothetical protein